MSPYTVRRVRERATRDCKREGQQAATRGRCQPTSSQAHCCLLQLRLEDERETVSQLLSPATVNSPPRHVAAQQGGEAGSSTSTALGGEGGAQPSSTPVLQREKQEGRENTYLPLIIKQ